MISYVILSLPAILALIACSVSQCVASYLPIHEVCVDLASDHVYSRLMLSILSLCYYENPCNNEIIDVLDINLL